MCLYILLRDDKKDGFLHNFVMENVRLEPFCIHGQVGTNFALYKVGVKNANK